jgi:predicted SprT family Zn-dependent metalloprotease
MTQELLRLRGVSPMSPEEALALTRRALDAFGLSEWRVQLTDFPAQQETKVENGRTYTRPRRRLGLCRYQAKTIEVSRSHVEQDRRDFVTETIAEEVAHALTEGDTNHGPRWKTAYENIKAILVADAEEQKVIASLLTK